MAQEIDNLLDKLDAYVALRARHPAPRIPSESMTLIKGKRTRTRARYAFTKEKEQLADAREELRVALVAAAEKLGNQNV